MTLDLPSAVDADHAAQLPGAPPPSPPIEPPISGPAWKRPLRKLKHTLQRAVIRVTHPAVGPVDDRVRDLHDRFGEVQRIADQINLDFAARSGVQFESQAVAVNLELLKGEVRQLKDLLADVGDAIAPATGIEGVAARFAELRERVAGLDRRVRTLVVGAQPDQQRGPATESAPTASATSQPDLFDYAGFERRFRGDPADVLALLDERYAALLAESAPVLDIGCGRAELVELLIERGVSAYGIDLDANLAADARARGLDVRHEDAITHLRSLAPGSLGSIITTHVVEHLELNPLLELLELAASRLRPGGLFIAETPNPATLVVLGNSYILDPTHVRPLHPSLLTFLCESVGFRHIELRFYAPAEGFQVSLVHADDAPDWVDQVNAGFARLNDVLFGPQEYAVLARTPPPTRPTSLKEDGGGAELMG